MKKKLNAPATGGLIVTNQAAEIYAPVEGEKDLDLLKSGVTLQIYGNQKFITDIERFVGDKKKFEAAKKEAKEKMKNKNKKDKEKDKVIYRSVDLTRL